MQPERILAQVSRYLAWLAGAIILFGCAVPITIDVISRQLLGRSLVESFEISGFALAAAIGLGMGYAVSTKANIRVDFLVARLPRPVVMVFDLIAAVSLAMFAVVLAYYCYTVVAQSYAIGAKSVSTLQVPMALPQGIWWMGLFWFATIAVLTPLLAVFRLIQGNSDAFAKALTTADLAEEMAQVGIETTDTSGHKT